MTRPARDHGKALGPFGYSFALDMSGIAAGFDELDLGTVIFRTERFPAKKPAVISPANQIGQDEQPNEPAKSDVIFGGTSELVLICISVEYSMSSRPTERE